VDYSSPNVLDGSITTAKLADNSVTAAKIAANAVQTQEIQVSAVVQAKIASGAVSQAKIDSATNSSAGNIGATDALNITMQPYCFWPMIHVQDQDLMYLSGHSVDAVDPDVPCFAIYNSDVVVNNYDVDWRYIDT
jgi:hypothetical protein